MQAGRHVSESSSGKHQHAVRHPQRTKRQREQSCPVRVAERGRWINRLSLTGLSSPYIYPPPPTGGSPERDPQGRLEPIL